MKTKTILSSWLYKTGLRLDGNPYISDGFEARETITNCKLPKTPLSQLTLKGESGVFIAPYFKRIYVENLNFGRYMLGNSDIQMLDPTLTASILSNKVFKQYPEQLKLEKGWTLITCFGTVGDMVYVREDMESHVGSTNYMRVIPDSSKISPGFLFAFLSSWYGHALVAQSETGSVIPNLLPSQVLDLEIPRLGTDLESKIDLLITKTAQKRTQALKLISESLFLLKKELNLPEIKGSDSFWTTQSSKFLNSRLDAFYFSEANKSAQNAFNSFGDLVQLKEVSSVFIPNIFKRLYSDDPKYGYPYITGSDVFRLAPKSDKYLLKTVAESNQLVLRKGMILVQEAGQLNGLIGNSVQVGSYLDGFACTNNMVRVTPHNPTDQGYLFSLLSSEYGVRLIQREAAGSSIPHIEVSRIQKLEIPWPDKGIRRKIGQPAMEAQALRDEACELEDQARKLVEETIEAAV